MMKFNIHYYQFGLSVDFFALKQPGVTRQPKVVIIVGSISSRVRATLRREEKSGLP